MSDLIDVEKYLDYMERETRDVFRGHAQHAPNPTWALASDADLTRFKRFLEVELVNDIPMGASVDYDRALGPKFRL